MMTPLVKEVFPDLIATDLISVQPLSAPTGTIYAPYLPSSFTRGWSVNPHCRKLELELYKLKKDLESNVLTHKERVKMKRRWTKLKNDIRHHKKRYAEEYV